MHFSQIVQAKKFQYYDTKDGWKNTVKYNSNKAPEIDISVISKVPVAMYTGLKDPVVDVRDAKWIFSQVQSVVQYMEIENYDHKSWTNGKNMDYL